VIPLPVSMHTGQIIYSKVSEGLSLKLSLSRSQTRSALAHYANHERPVFLRFRVNADSI
jgi:hypothetical protein